MEKLFAKCPDSIKRQRPDSIIIDDTLLQVFLIEFMQGMHSGDVAHEITKILSTMR